MNDALLSPLWYRAADLTPRLSPGVRLTRMQSRDRIWHVLGEPASGRQVRLNPSAYAFVGRCNGGRTANEIWAFLLEHLGEQAPTQDDILRVLSQLYAAQIIQFDSAPNLGALFAQRDDEGRKRRRKWINPLVIRVRLFDPTRLLNHLEPVLAIIPGGLFTLAWSILVVLGLGITATHYPALQADAMRLLQSSRAFLLFWLCFPLIKAVHELAHALAVRRFGGEVHEAGVTLMFFTPAPYVDASAANTFESRGLRAIVSAAGIFAELAIAALAVIAWSTIEQGTVRDILLVIILICGVSTLLVNGNPLLRFDGYYIFTDLLDLPNLALRSNAWWASTVRRLATGADNLANAALGSGERKWLILYAPASLIYRAVLMLGLLLWLGQKSSLLGTLMLLFLAAWLFGTGLAIWRTFRGAGLSTASRQRARRVVGTAVVIAILLAFVLPLPNTFVAQGVVWPPENAQIRVDTPGFVENVAAHNGQAVATGQTVVTLLEPTLESEHERLVNELSGYESRQYFALLRDPTEAASVEKDIERTKAALDRNARQIEQLDVSARTAGTLVLPHEHDLPGSFTPRGAMVGYVLAPGAPNVRAVLPEADAQLIRGRVRHVDVLEADLGSINRPAQSLREMPAATNLLPSPALGDRAGGGFAIDPADKEGTRTRDPVFLIDMAVPGLAEERIGNRVWVRFDLGYAPLATQALRRGRQLFLRHFNPEDQT
ncbi:MAG: hypothetical protein JWN73_1891 [Betaproteobacteria bacterium]|nr:hypothetical protein [Betaproteobacteria bacterium]